jgi:amidophosphoribosyltransferase
MCGIIALWNPSQNQTLSNLIDKLKKLQHRGQDSFGYGYLDHKNILKIHKEPGLVKDYTSTDHLSIKANFAVGHLRYTTSGSRDNSSSIESQPLGTNEFIVCHNGNLPNHSQLEKDLSLTTKWLGSDTQLLSMYLEFLYKKHQSWEEVMTRVMQRIPGVYCLLVLTIDGLWIARDKYGLRPLLIAGNKDIGWAIGSESVIFSESTSELNFKNVDPGSLSYIRKDGILTKSQIYASKLIPCIFEYIYFMNPDSVIEDQSVSEFRRHCGILLAQKETYQFDCKYIVIGAPSTGLIPAEKYAETLGLNYRPEALEKRENVGRTFILENNDKRINACYNKYNFNEAIIRDSYIILIDDSLVRGNTLKVINQILREKGAKEIHVRIASPSVKNPCYFGIDIPTSQELIINSYNNLEMLSKDLFADSLVYLELEDMSKAFKEKPFCSSCFDGKYNSKLLEW